MTSGIYLIENIINSKKYVGSAKNINKFTLNNIIVRTTIDYGCNFINQYLKKFV